MILEGHIPTWMLYLVKPGARSAHPRMRQEIGLAVAHKKLCDAGIISDRHSTKSIADLFGVTRQSVQKSMTEYSYSEPSDWFPEAPDEAERARLIQEALRKSAEHYRVWGRAAATINRVQIDRNIPSNCGRRLTGTGSNGRGRDDQARPPAQPHRARSYHPCRRPCGPAHWHRR
jgi:hypothetical protein